MERGLVVWRYTDGKRGHERQTEGLVAALAARSTLEVHDLAAGPSSFVSIVECLAGRCGGGAGLPSPQLILGAGRACQWPMLAARRARGGRAVYLMRPGLPLACFDLCIIPGHDSPRRSRRVIVSDGPLNPVRRQTAPDARCGLILLGGPSAHHAWDTESVVRDVALIAARRTDIDWQVGDSRRSPPALGAALSRQALRNVTFHAHARTPPEWLPEALARAAYVWVSADSVAMIYEALTSGAAVGVIDVPAKREDRITAVAAELNRCGRVTRLSEWLAKGRMPAAAHAPDEANRCAALLLQRWPEMLRAGSVD